MALNESCRACDPVAMWAQDDQLFMCLQKFPGWWARAFAKKYISSCPYWSPWAFQLTSHFNGKSSGRGPLDQVHAIAWDFIRCKNINQKYYDTYLIYNTPSKIRVWTWLIPPGYIWTTEELTVEDTGREKRGFQGWRRIAVSLMREVQREAPFRNALGGGFLWPTG